MSIRIALAGNPNSGKTTLFNALTGSNQFVGNWPGVTVEKKEGKLKGHTDVIITDLPGIYSLSPYTLEEVVARNYLINERPDAILNIVDGSNLERNLYLTTQLVELGIPVVVAINMMDVVKKNGDKIDTKRLSEQIGCRIVEISALKGTGIQEAAEEAIKAAQGTKTVPMHSFSGPVEHALAHIEEAVVHGLPEEQQRWYAIKVFERDSKVMEQLDLSEATKTHIEQDIAAAEKELDDDAESIITNERYVWIGNVIKTCYKKKGAGKLSTSDKIDRIVTNRWLGLPIFAVVMFIVYWVAMVGVGAPATDWANDGLFGDGYHLIGIGDRQAEEAADDYSAASNALEAYGFEFDTEDEAFDGDALIAELKAFSTDEKTAVVEVQDEETLALSDVTVYFDEVPADADEDVNAMSFKDAIGYFEEKGFDEPDPADYGVWVPGIPALIDKLLLDAEGNPKVPEWLYGLIMDGIVAGVGAVLGFVPQMLVLFLMLAFLEACGYMARIAFVLDRIFRRFGLSGKSFIPMLIGAGCGIPGIMASRTIENERDRRMTIMTKTGHNATATDTVTYDDHDDHVHPLRREAAVHCHDRGRDLPRLALDLRFRVLHRRCGNHRLRHYAEEDEDVRGRSRSVCYGAACVPLADARQRAPFDVGARLVVHQEGGHDHPAFHDRHLVPLPLRRQSRNARVRHARGGRDRVLDPRHRRQSRPVAVCTARLG